MTTLKKLLETATAGEQCLIAKVKELVELEALKKVLESFSKNLEKNFHPSMRWEGEELRQILQRTLKETQEQLGK